MSEYSSIFADPLLGAIYQVLHKQPEIPRGGFLEQLQREVERSRKRRNLNVFDRNDDPVLTSIERMMQSKQIQIKWEKIIFIGCSAGGDRALRALFEKIDYPHLPIVIAMHHNPGFLFLSKLKLANGIEQYPILIEDDVAIKSGKVYFAPGEKILTYHLQNLAFKLTELAGKQRFRPVIDKIFSIAGQRFKDQLVAIILTGMLEDGAAGCKDVFLNHGQVIVQTPNTAMFKDMPTAAIASVPSAKQLTIEQMAREINSISRKYLIPTSFRSVLAAIGA